MHKHTVIRSASGIGVAIFHFREMNSPSWVHVRQDYYIPANDLSLIKHEVKTEGRYFTDRCVTSHDGRYLLVEEMAFDGTPESVDRHTSCLVLIDVKESKEACVGCIERGICWPKRIDAGTLIYSKSRWDEIGVLHNYERDIESITEWKKLV